MLPGNAVLHMPKGGAAGVGNPAPGSGGKSSGAETIPFSQDLEVRVNLSVPIATDVLSLNARVVFISPHGIGIQFSQLSSELRSSLQLYAERCRAIAAFMPSPAPALPATEPASPSAEVSANPAPTDLPSASPQGSSSVPEPVLVGAAVTLPVDEDPSQAPRVRARTFEQMTARPFEHRAESDGSFNTYDAPQPFNEDASELRTAVASIRPLPESESEAEQIAFVAAEMPPEATRQAVNTAHIPYARPEPARNPPRKTLEGTVASLEQAGMNLPDLALELARHFSNGLLLIQSSDARREVYFQAGLVLLTSEEPMIQAHLLGEVLVDQGLLRHAELDPAVRGALKERKPLGQYLIRENLLGARELAYGLRRQAQLRLWSALSFQQGTYAVWENVSPRVRPMSPPISVQQTVWRERINAYRTALAEEFDARIDPILDRFLHRTPDAPEDLSPFGLSDEEQRFWNLIVVGRYSIREAFQVSPTTRMRTYATILTLLDLRLARLDTDMAQHWKESNLRERLFKKLSRMEHGSLFNVLELHWSATEQEVKEAHERMLVEYDLSRLNYPFGEDLPPVADEIRRRCTEAYESLKTLQQRMRYRRDILESSQLTFSSTLLHEQADMHFYRGAYAEAYQAYARSLELDPGNHELQRKVTELGNRLKQLL